MATRKKKNNIGAFGHPIYGKGFAKYGEMQLNGSSEIPADLEEAAEHHICKAVDAVKRRGWELETQDIAEAFIAGYEAAEKDLAPLIEAATIVYEAWNGGTMDDVRKAIAELGKRIKEDEQ